MFIKQLLRASLTVAVLVVNQASAAEEEQVSTRLYVPKKPPPKHDDHTHRRQTKTMGDCAPHITSCGATDDVKIIHEPISTEYSTHIINEEVIKLLPDQIHYVTHVEIVTVNNETEGHCRKTITVQDDKPITVKVDVVVTTTREVVNIIDETIIEYQTVTANSVEQCFINSDVLTSRRPGSHPAPTPSSRKSSNEPTYSIARSAEITEARTEVSSEPEEVLQHDESETSQGFTPDTAGMEIPNPFLD
ncbi:hypothetical protein FBULB1_7067 [Fusarium bulbicola]|nr:hypothetical protein FBULB1_7067 [Fusarium bulbicola]